MRNSHYQYEHVDPPFKDAKEHDPARIVLLCAGCHDRVTRGLLAKETVQLHSQAPACLQAGYSFGAFDVGRELPELTIGGFRARVDGPLLMIEGDRILAISQPETEGGPFLIDALMSDSQGREILRIERNEWRSPVSNWDVEVTGQRITFRTRLGEIALVLRSDPPNRLIVERLNLMHKGARVEVSADGVAAVTPKGGKTTLIRELTIERCKIGINIFGTKIGIGFQAENTHIGSMTVNTWQRHATIPKRPKQGGNEPCACLSGKKCKKCCGW